MDLVHGVVHGPQSMFCIRPYTERLGHYFDANGIGDESGGDKAKVYVYVCGSKVYKLMCDLLAPAKPKEKS